MSVTSKWLHLDEIRFFFTSYLSYLFYVVKNVLTPLTSHCKGLSGSRLYSSSDWNSESVLKGFLSLWVLLPLPPWSESSPPIADASKEYILLKTNGGSKWRQSVTLFLPCVCVVYLTFLLQSALLLFLLYDVAYYIAVSLSLLSYQTLSTLTHLCEMAQ